MDKVLHEDERDDIVNSIGYETYDQCLDLQKALHKSSNNGTANFTQPAPQPSLIVNGSNIPQIFKPFYIFPWKSSQIPDTLPPLPAVLDQALERAAFIHTNATSGTSSAVNYERLEWVGDAYMELVATLLIAQTFPNHSPGKQAQLRELCVKNLTLARFAVDYCFDKRVKLGQNFKNANNEMTKIHGDIFEAYVAAVVLSDPDDGLPRVAEWLKGLWGRLLKKEIQQEEANGNKVCIRVPFEVASFSTGLEILKASITNSLQLVNPMWKLVGDNQAILKTQKAEPNAKDQLQKAIGGKGVTIKYDDIGAVGKDRNNKLALFTVGVYLTGWGEKNLKLGFGSDNGKKTAGMKAARMALDNKKMMEKFLARKKVQDEQDELEKAAREQAMAGGG